MLKIVEALAEIDDVDHLWRVRYYISLAQGHDERADAFKSAANDAESAKEFDAAADAIDQARKLIADHPDEKVPVELLEELSRVQVHLSRQENPKCKALMTTEVLSGVVVDPEGGDDTNTIRQATMIKLQCIQSGITQPEILLEELTATLEKVDPATLDPRADTKGGDLEMAIEIGRVALANNLDSLAEQCLNSGETRGKNGSQRMRVCCDYLKCAMMTRELKPSSAASGNGKRDWRGMEALRLSRRIEALKVLERALTSCRRLGDANLLQEGCVLAWNLGMVLLQPHLRKHVHRLFAAAASSLEEIGSPLTQLRAQLHFELAKCEVTADFLSKASSQVTKALGMDYGEIKPDIAPAEVKEGTPTDTEEATAEAENDGLRPLDKFMRPLKSKLELKASLYKEPDSAEEQTLLQLEQAKEAKDHLLKISILGRAAAILEGAVKAEQAERMEVPAEATAAAAIAANNGDTEGTKDIPPAAPLIKQRTALWAEIVKLGWEHKMIHIVQQGAKHILATEWDKDQNKEFKVMQAEVHFVVTESYVEELKQTPTAEPLTESGLDPRTLGIKQESLEHHLTELKERVIEGFMNGLDVGIELNESWIIENAVVYLWNYHNAVFKGKQEHLENVMPELVAALKKSYTALKDMSPPNTNIPLFASVSEALALIYEQQEQYDEAVKICEDALPKGESKPLAMKEVVAVLVRVQQTKGMVPSTADYSMERKVISTIQMIDNPSPEVTSETKVGYLNDAILALREMPLPVPGPSTTLEQDEEAMQLFAELWTRLSRQALDLDQQIQAQGCAQQAVKGLPEEANARARVPPRVWRWYSVAECVCGQSITAMIVADGQEKALQDELRIAALQHQCLAANFGVKAKSAELVAGAASYFWNIALPLMGTAMTRSLLFSHLQLILNELAAVGERSRMDLRVGLYEVLFECYTDQAAWQDGLNAVEQAFQYVPAQYQKTLWQARVVFMSKLGRSVQEGLSKMKQSDAVLQARVWASLARASADPGAQLSAYAKALETLDGSFARLDYMIELGEWFLVNEISRDDVQEQLRAAADMLLEIDEFAIEDDEADDEQSEGRSVAQSRMSRQSSRSGRSKSSTMRKRTKAGSTIGSKKAGSSKSGGGSRNGKRSSSRSGTRKTGSRKTGSVGSDSEGGVVGDPKMLNVGHLERLVRIHAMLSHVASSHSERLHHALVAQHYVVRLWQCTFQTANCSACQEEFGQLPVEQKEELTLEAFAELPNVIKFVMPSSLSGWAHFYLSDDLREQIKNPIPTMREKTINATTFDKLPLTVHYLRSLSDTLRAHGCHLQSIPILLLLEYSAEVMSPPLPPLVTLAKLQLASTLDQLNLPACSAMWLKMVQPLGLPSEEEKKYAGDVEQLEQQQQQTSSKTVGGKGLRKRRKYDLQQLPVRELWMAIARCAVDLGQHKPAKELLLGCSRHNIAFGDDENMAHCLVLQAEISFLEGRITEAIEFVSTAQKQEEDDLEGWYTSSSLLVKLLVAANRTSEATTVLKRLIDVFDAKRRVEMNGMVIRDSQAPPDLDADASYYTALLRAMLAELLGTTVLQQQQQGRPWKGVWKEIQALLVQSEDTLEDLQHHNALIGVLRKHAELLIAVSCDGGRSAKAGDLQKAIVLLNTAEVHAMHMMQTVCPPDLSPLISIPAARLLAAVQEELARVTLAMAATDTDNVKALADGNEVDEEDEELEAGGARQQALAKKKDEWLAITAPKRLPLDDEMRLPHVEQAMAYATSALGLVQRVDRLRPRAACEVGCCLRLLAAQHGELDGIWEPSAASSQKLQPVDPGDKTGEPAPVATPAPMPVEGAFREQAIAHLKEAVASALKQEQWMAAGHAARELVECHGWRDENAALQYLCVYQSCMARQHMLQLLQQAHAPDNRECLFMSLRERLRSTKMVPEICQMYTDADTVLENTSVAWKRLDCTDIDVDAMGAALKEKLEKDVGKDVGEMRVLVLQQSPDGRTLYGGVFAPDQDIRAVGKVAFTREDRAELRAIAKELKTFQNGLSKLLLHYCDDAGANGDTLPKEGEPPEEPDTDTFEGDFTALMDRMNALLAPLLNEPIKLALGSLASTYVVIVADAQLAELPLEGLSVVQGAKSVSRDFSLHMLNARTMGLLPAQCTRSAMPDPTKLPTVKDQDTSYIIDARFEDTAPPPAADGEEETRKTITENWKFVLAESKELKVDETRVVQGEDHIPSPGEWQNLLKDRRSGGVVYYGMGRSLAYCLPSLVAGLDLSACNFVFLVDQAENDISNRRQSKLDNQKTADVLDLEQPLQTAALLSLTGVNAVILNRWASSLHMNGKLVQHVLPVLAGKKDTLGCVLQAEVRPSTVAPVEEDPAKKKKSKGAKDAPPEVVLPLKNRVRYNTVLYGLPFMKCE
jgi:tetratricopeptide (TPR) repeat protein